MIWVGWQLPHLTWPCPGRRCRRVPPSCLPGRAGSRMGKKRSTPPPRTSPAIGSARPGSPDEGREGLTPTKENRIPGEMRIDPMRSRGPPTRGTPPGPGSEAVCGDLVAGSRRAPAHRAQPDDRLPVRVDDEERPAEIARGALEPMAASAAAAAEPRVSPTSSGPS